MQTSEKTPSQIVSELDKYIIGQKQAKKAVAVALRNRYRRMQLNDEMQEVGYKELLGLSGHKPFECVGEVEECRYAWFLLQNMPDWKDDILIQKIKVEQQEGNLFIPSLKHMIPKEFQDAFKRFVE